MELYDVMRTTFACREWTDEPVNDATLYRMLDNARFAPTGGNRQGQHVIVVRDKEIRRRLVPLVRESTAVYRAQQQAGEAPWNTIVPTTVDEVAIRTAAAAETGPVPFAGINQMVDAPVVLVVAIDLSVVASFDKYLNRVGLISGASIYPLVWNILLAARNEGLGGVLTTYLADKEPLVQAVLGLPEHLAVAAMLPIGVPVKQLTKLSRNPVPDFVTIDRWDGVPFTS